MSKGIDIPPVIFEVFPVLASATFSEQFTLPDTTFDIFTTKSGHLLTLVTTDYADPQDQSRELKDISGRYEFIDLVKPRANHETIKILEHDDMEGDFLISLPHKTYKLDYYIANTTKS